MRADGVTTEDREAAVQPLNKERVAHCFRQAIATYDLHATVQQRIGERLLKLAGQHPAISYEQVLEIGCCTGILTEMLCRQHRISTLFLNDLVSDFAKVVKARIPADRTPEICPLFGDIEAMPLPHDLDLIVSSSTFQWLSDLPAFLPRLVPALRDRGFLVFSIFGPGTLMEFTELTGVGLSYRSPEQIAGLLDPHFILEHQQTLQDQLFLPSPRDVLHHLRDTGVGGVRTHRWTSSTLKLFEQQYKARFGTPEGVPVSYTSTCYIVRKK
jgi:malonyl-ACP O-methyltransferase BioC